mmetsp:Transcript_152800/g.266328  ORF Transcript_152800/g.266328 Transcript_152800/m.266328 type:complete len:366 (+) Transcript_152800:67-1164(+)
MTRMHSYARVDDQKLLSLPAKIDSHASADDKKMLSFPAKIYKVLVSCSSGDGVAAQDPCQWDASAFAQAVAQAKLDEDWGSLKKLLAQVARSNYRIRDCWPIPRTVLVTHMDCVQYCSHVNSKVPVVSFSSMTTGEALLHFARDKGKATCALNFANGEHPGGGYRHGATAQEEDLCRQIPTLYTSLNNASKKGLYPYGPSTFSSQNHPGRYSDVLYTPGLTVAREGVEEGYDVLSAEKEATVSLVSAAAPNLRSRKGAEHSDMGLLYEAVQSIFIAPIMMDAGLSVLILGAWGCGAFGGDPYQIAELFVQAIARDNLGRHYDEVHFAIPSSSKDRNAEAFRTVFSRYNLQVLGLDGECEAEVVAI